MPDATIFAREDPQLDPELDKIWDTNFKIAQSAVLDSLKARECTRVNADIVRNLYNTFYPKFPEKFGYFLAKKNISPKGGFIQGILLTSSPKKTLRDGLCEFQKPYGTVESFYQNYVEPHKAQSATASTSSAAPIIPATSVVKATPPLSHFRTLIQNLKDGSVHCLRKEHDPSFQVLKQKKIIAYEKSLQQYEKLQLRDSPQPLRLKDISRFHPQTGDFSNIKFRAWGGIIESKPEFYAYEKNAWATEYWVDFANTRLGGGCFEGGFVQEETQVIEIPAFAEYIAARRDFDLGTGGSRSKEFVRQPLSGYGDQVGCGIPNPLALKGMHRVVAVSKECYGKLDSFDPEKHLSPLPEPQLVNILAMAAPKLASKKHSEQFSVATLTDLLATCMAGFSLVAEEAQQIGCGAFNNSPKAAFLIQCLVARQLGINIHLHGYSKENGERYLKEFSELIPDLNGKSLRECMNYLSLYLQGNPN